ncbi:MAG: hypothetical protein K2P84_04505 [Undibacterium sp.]|nr:hypothetical protein [Undibacterium sp.]
MTTQTQNPVLNFFFNLTDAAKYFWHAYVDWTLDSSWGKLFLAFIFAMIIGSAFCLYSLVKSAILCTLLVKIFIRKEKSNEVFPNHTEEN